MEGAAYWLAHYGLLSLLSQRTQDHLHRGATTHSGLGPPVNQESACTQDSLTEALSQLRSPLPRVTLARVNLTKDQPALSPCVIYIEKLAQRILNWFTFPLPG